MSKAILELPEVPENCRQCVLSTKKIYRDSTEMWACAGLEIRQNIDKYFFEEPLINSRPEFCPLKIM